MVRAEASQSPPPVAEKTKEQADAVSEAVVSSINTVATKTVEEAENIVVTAGVVRKVRPGPQPGSQASPILSSGPQRGQLGRRCYHRLRGRGDPCSVFSDPFTWNSHSHPCEASLRPHQKVSLRTTPSSWCLAFRIYHFRLVNSGSVDPTW